MTQDTYEQWLHKSQISEENHKAKMRDLAERARPIVHWEHKTGVFGHAHPECIPYGMELMDLTQTMPLPCIGSKQICHFCGQPGTIVQQ